MIYKSGYYEKKVINNLVLLIWRLFAMMSVMGGGGAEKLRFKTYTLYFPSSNMRVPQKTSKTYMKKNAQPQNRILLH
jgi:hypothetical protein